MTYKELDFTKPIETLDGHRCVRAADNRWPDDVGDYWIVREDGKPFDHDESHQAFVNIYGCDYTGAGDHTENPIVRNVSTDALDFTKPFGGGGHKFDLIDLGEKYAVVQGYFDDGQPWNAVALVDRVTARTVPIVPYTRTIRNLPETVVTHQTTHQGVGVNVTYVDGVATKVELA